MEDNKNIEFCIFLGKKEIFDYYFVQIMSLNQTSERNKLKFFFGYVATFYDNFEEELIVISFFKKIIRLYNIKIIFNG